MTSKYFKTKETMSEGLMFKPRKGDGKRFKHTVFLDANILGILLKTQNPLDIVRANISPAKVKPTEVINIITSPFALHEYLGVKIERPDYDLFVKKDGVTPSLDKCINLTQETVSEFYSLEKNFSLSKLRTRVLERKKYIGKNAVLILDNIVRPFLEEKFKEKIIQHLTWDYICSVNYPEEYKIEIHETFLRQMDNLHASKINLSVARSAFELVKFFSKKVKIDEPYKPLRHLKLKFKGDFLDTELLHFALFGWHFAKEELKQTHCYTCDPVEIVENRINDLVVVYTIFHREAFYDGDIERPSLEIKPGYIHCFEKGTLNKIKTIDVSEIVKKYSFLKEERNQIADKNIISHPLGIIKKIKIFYNKLF